jgi:hypothetical protein
MIDILVSFRLLTSDDTHTFSFLSIVFSFCLLRFGLAVYEGRGLRCFHDTLPAYQSPIAELVTNYPIRTYVSRHESPSPPNADENRRGAEKSRSSFSTFWLTL